LNLTQPEHSLAFKATLACEAGGYAEGALPAPKPVPSDLAVAPKPFIHPIVFAGKNDLQAAKLRHAGSLSLANK
jgi:hypothetical protein